MAYRAKTTNLDAEVGKLKAANPDVFLPTSYTSDAILFVKTAKNLDYNPKLLIAQNAGWTDPIVPHRDGQGRRGAHHARALRARHGGEEADDHVRSTSCSRS